MTSEKTPFMWPPNCDLFFKGTQNKLFSPFSKTVLVTEFCKLRSQRAGYPFWDQGDRGLLDAGHVSLAELAAPYQIRAFLNVSDTSIKSPSQTKQNRTPTAPAPEDSKQLSVRAQPAESHFQKTLSSRVTHTAQNQTATRRSESQLDPRAEPFCRSHQRLPLFQPDWQQPCEVYFKKLSLHSNWGEAEYAVLNSQRSLPSGEHRMHCPRRLLYHRCACT